MRGLVCASDSSFVVYIEDGETHLRSFNKREQRERRRKKSEMPEYEERYEGNGEEVDTYDGGPSPQPRESSHGGPDDHSDSKSHVCFFSIHVGFC